MALRYKTGRIYYAVMRGEPDMFWKFQVIGVIEHEAKRYAICHKICDGPPSSLQCTVFDEDGQECESPHSDFRLCYAIQPKKKWSIVV
ncbi:MAG: hypothetical protein ACXAB9_11855 [Candidatus Thorarchaeota archaeon]|jgi:hypothetical protein